MGKLFDRCAISSCQNQRVLGAIYCPDCMRVFAGADWKTEEPKCEKPPDLEERKKKLDRLMQPKIECGDAGGAPEIPLPRPGRYERWGDGSMGHCGPGPQPAREPCNGPYRTGQSLADLSRLPGGAVNLAAMSAFQMSITPQHTQFFEPVAAAVSVIESSNVQVNTRALFTAVAISYTPQEAFHEMCPGPRTVAGILSDMFDPAAQGGPLPVRWGVFSVAALTHDLQIFGFNPNEVAIDVRWLIWGNGLDMLPPGIRCGQPR